MKSLRPQIPCLFVLIFATHSLEAQEWANLNHYREANQQLKSTSSSDDLVVFMGNSITESWIQYDSAFFTENPFVNRGISGQTSPQMLLRFRSDVIDLEPVVVVLLAGTNDIAGNTGPMTLDMIMANITSMVELAKANDIKVVLCSVLPAASFSWRPDLHPAQKIIALNKLIEDYCRLNAVEYLDYHSVMTNPQNGLLDKFTYDGVHPNETGYKVMSSLVLNSISSVLAAP